MQEMQYNKVILSMDENSPETDIKDQMNTQN